jgi:hypothetical protein
VLADFLCGGNEGRGGSWEEGGGEPSKAQGRHSKHCALDAALAPASTAGHFTAMSFRTTSQSKILVSACGPKKSRISLKWMWC